MKELIPTAYRLFGIRLTERQVMALVHFERELIIGSRRYNLTAIRDEQGIRVKHFLDSFSCVLAWKSCPPTRLVDVGSGAGFPGIPLKIIYPKMQITLVESVGKKVNFCHHVIETLGLKNAEVLNTRAEEIGHISNYRESYDWAVARSVAHLPVLVEYMLPLLKVGGHMLALKGESGPLEAQKAERAIKVLGGQLKQIIPVILPGVSDERCLVLIEKIAATPLFYPRRPGIPAKKPL